MVRFESVRILRHSRKMLRNCFKSRAPVREHPTGATAPKPTDKKCVLYGSGAPRAPDPYQEGKTQKGNY